MSPNNQTLTLLTIPPEIRNLIYAYLFVPPVNDAIPQRLLETDPSPIATALLNDASDPCDPAPKHQPSESSTRTPRLPTRLSPILTCRLIHHEAQLLALSTTPFHLRSPLALPENFTLHARALSPAKLHALKHLTLTARITHLRALNETWHGRPFGQTDLQLETLTLVPRRPDAGGTAWAEVAELDQCHTLAHVLAETLKVLGGVEEVRVVNLACFGEAVWRLAYRHLVLKVWRWGGRNCGVRVECSGEGEGEWFKAFLGRLGMEGPGGAARGRDVAVEACRLLGVEGVSPGVVAGMP